MNDTPLVIQRIFNAPIEKVWKAWTDPEEVKKWWGPKDFTAPSISIDFREGGKYLFCMRGKLAPDAPEQDMWSTGTYKEIIPMKKIVCTDSFSDKDGNVVSPKEYGMEGVPDEFEFTIYFEEAEGGKTKMTVEHRGFPEGQDKVLATQGLNQSFDKFAQAVQ
ncbi:MAG: SRPBCC domain-containing protein [Patescibacteria group bacterium]|jgi:uncharacterized protein YndB with AHSA1/START domain